MLRAPLLTASLLALSLAAIAQPPSRIHQSRLSDSDTFTLNGNVHPDLESATDLGEVDASLPLSRVSFHFRLTSAQQADLTHLLSDLQDANSPRHHKFLSPDEYRDRFGLNASDTAKVVDWLQRAGFSDIEVSPERTSIAASGTAAQVQNALHVSLRRYRVHGETHFANANSPELPKALRGVVSSIRGLNDFHPHHHGPKAHPNYTSSISGSHFITPEDFATIYDVHTLYNEGLNGSGISIAVAGQTDIANSDIEAFRAAAGLPASDPIIKIDGTDPGKKTDDVAEASMDVELAGGVARNATIVYVVSDDALTSLEYVIDNNVAPVASISYGLCESQVGTSITALETEMQKANALGITILSAAGDEGAADCDYPTGKTPTKTATHGLGVDYPSSSQYVTGVGGTEFTDAASTFATQYWAQSNSPGGGSALSYIPETAWNDTNSTNGLSAGGGGASSKFPKPSWQTGIGVPNDGKRDVPDVSLLASPAVDPVLICESGWCTNGFRNSSTYLDTSGGTSVGAPTMAGIVALLNQKVGTRLGNINPMLYSIAASTPGAFHDITTGNNVVPCTTGSADCTTGSLGYSAGVGYDQVTGLGSPEVTNLVNAWTDFTMSLASTSASLTAAATATINVNITRTPFFNGPVSFTCASSTTALSCTPPGSITNSGTGVLTLTRPAATARFAPLGNIDWQLPTVMLTLLGAACLVSRKRRELLWGGATATLLIASACGGGSSSTVTQSSPTPIPVATPSTATVTLTATAGSQTQTATVNVTLD